MNLYPLRMIYEIFGLRLMNILYIGSSADWILIYGSYFADSGYHKVYLFSDKEDYLQINLIIM